MLTPEQTQLTLEWLDQVCQHALNEARKENLGPVKQIGANTALQYYFHIVHRIPSLSAARFAEQYPQLMEQASDLREQYEAKVADATRLQTLEAQVEKLTKMVEQLTTPAEAPVVVPAPTEAEGETPAVTSGEGEPETVDEVEPPAEVEPKKGKGK